MSNLKFITLLCFMLLLQACGGSDNSSESEVQPENTPAPEEQVDKYADGTYCARIDYDNPSTGTHGIYQLNVEVVNHEVVKINFPNGGWLDEDHFTAEQLDENGTCSFISDKNCNYTVEILGDECTFEQSRSYLTLKECATLNQITDAELKVYLKENSALNSDTITMSRCESFVKYMREIRKINQSMGALNNEMNEGYIQSVLFASLPNITCHQVIVKKHGKYYWLEVSGSEKCTMGTMKFNANQSGWQIVAVKQSPDDTDPNGYQMKVKGSSNSLSELDAKVKAYCNL